MVAQTTALFPLKVPCSLEWIKAGSFRFAVVVFFLLFNAATFAACDLVATRVGGGDKRGNQIKIPLYYPAVAMPLAGIRARLRSSARCVLRGLPPVHKRNYSDRRAGNTKRPSVPVGGTEEDRTAPSGPHPEWEPSRKTDALERCTPSVQFSASEKCVVSISRTENAK